MAARGPDPAYPAKDSAVLYGDKELYARVGKVAEGKGGKELVDSFEIPIRSGKAWVIKKGQLCELSTPLGPQVGDLNIFSLHNPRERFWAARTRQLHASHVSVGDRLWSNLPYLRPLVTIVADSLKDYGVDEVGGRCHDLLGTRCDPYGKWSNWDGARQNNWLMNKVNKLLSGDDFDFQCHSNLVRAVLPYGLTEADVHDVLNVFQVTGLNQDGKYFMLLPFTLSIGGNLMRNREASPSKPGDYFTFFAETDLLCAMSTCPGGDLSVYGWGEDSAQRMLETCRPLGVAVYDILEKEEVLKGWKESKRPGYRGLHGLKIPSFVQ